MIRTLSLVILLAGCATKPLPTPEPVIRTVTVNVPVAAPCVPATLHPAPDYPDTDSALKSAADAAERYLLTIAGRELRVARLAELEPIVAGCPKGTK